MWVAYGQVVGCKDEVVLVLSDLLDDLCDAGIRFELAGVFTY